ncbi:MAG TPA: HlyD family efflux transporter periplasmic adaptor subunit [Thermoanaerobaculia bacterium]
MALLFSRTLRSLAASSARRRRAALVTGVVVLLAWGVWAVAARVSIVAVSTRARLEARRAVQRIAAPSSGRVVRANLALGQQVRRGEVLIELDGGEEGIRRSRFESDVENLTRRIGAINAQIAATRDAAAAQLRSAESKLRQARESSEEARQLASINREKAKRSAALSRDGLISPTAAEDDLRRADADDARVRSFVAAEEEVRKAAQEAEAGALARLREIESDRIELEQQLAAARNSLRATDLAIERLRVRAPVDGRVTSSTEPKTGVWLAAGETLCSIVPDDPVEVAAWFRLESMPLIRGGQEASIWVNGLTPNSRTILRASVIAIEHDPSGDEFKVRLRLDPKSVPQRGADQGFPAVAVVEVQRLSPLQALFRAAGMVRGT